MSFYAIVSAETGQWTLTIQDSPEPSLRRIYGPEPVIWLHRDDMPDRDAVDRWLPEGWRTTGENVSEQYRCVFPVTGPRFSVRSLYSNDAARWHYKVVFDGEEPPPDDFFDQFYYTGPNENLAKGRANAGNRAIKDIPVADLPVYDREQLGWIVYHSEPTSSQPRSTDGE